MFAPPLLAATLLGCNAVEDVREAPFTPVPAEGVVLQGRVIGPLGNQRAVTLLNNGDNDHAVAVTASLGTDYTIFTFGVVPVGSTYRVTVKNNPFGKNCTVTGGTGTVTTAEALDIVVNCVNDPAVPRYNLRVAIPPDFGGRTGAKVTLTTEEGSYVVSPMPGATSVTYTGVLFNNVVGGTVWGANSPGTTASTSTANGGINPYTNIVGGTVNGATFAWKVTATTTEGSTPDKPQLNNCAVSAGANFTGTTSGFPTPAPTPNYSNVAMPPVGNIGFGTVTSQIPTVGACTFGIGGNVSYSYPPGTTPPAAVQALPAGGLDLQLKDVQGNIVETLTYTGGYGASPAATTAGTAYSFITPLRSSVNSVYDVTVSRHPTGHYCVVTNGGQATLGLATANISNANVVCRARPTGASNNARLKGMFLFLNGTTYNYSSPAVAGTATTTTSTAADGTVTTTTVTPTTLNTRTTYLSDFSGSIAGATPTPAGESWGQILISDLSTRTTISVQPPGGTSTTVSDTTVLSTSATTNNNITRNFLAFFEDGTFLHGVHGAGTSSTSNQIEHGFYLYDTVAGTLSFTLITDTSTGVSSAAAGSGTAAVNNATGLVNTGFTGTGGQATINGSQTATMTAVSRGVINGRPTLSGRFAAVSGSTVGYGTTVPGSRWSTWTLIEPKNTDGLMEGAFSTQDHRRVWIYDDNPKLGFHVGVNGGAANLQDACYTVANSTAASGYYTRRGGISGCLGAIAPVDLPQGRTSQTNPPVGTPAALESLPGFVGRIPGGQIAVDGRPPSPIYYVIARADQFAQVAAADPSVSPFFPASEITPAALGWCMNSAGSAPGEVYGVRASLNNAPINKAVYFCRARAN